MPTPREIQEQMDRLRIHRQNLSSLLTQQALQGGRMHATPQVNNGIREARQLISHSKAVLRGWGVEVGDHPDDGEVGDHLSSSPPSPAPSPAIIQNIQIQSGRDTNLAGRDIIQSSPSDGDNIDTRESVGSINRPQATNTSSGCCDGFGTVDAESGKLMVFLCYAPRDYQIVKDRLYQRLRNGGFRPWMKDEDLLPGEREDLATARAIRESDVFLACLTQNSSVRGQFHQHLNEGINVAKQQPEGTIFLIPVLLEPCEVPNALEGYTGAYLYRNDGYDRLLKALRVRERNLRLRRENNGV